MQLYEVWKIIQESVDVSTYMERRGSKSRKEHRWPQKRGKKNQQF